MKVLLCLSYFYPYHSGLSFYAGRLAEGLAARGHELLVLCSQHDPSLPLEEERDGYRIRRIPVGLRLSKGVLMPSLPAVAKKCIAWADVVNLHLPQFESFIYSYEAKRQKKPVVITYHCDLQLTHGLLNKIAGRVTVLLGNLSLKRAACVVQNTLDYAQNSPVLRPFLDKTIEIPTPIQSREVPAERARAFRDEHGIAEDDQVIALAGRVAREKGHEYLAAVLPDVLQACPQARVVHAGVWQGVLGEEAYLAELEQQIAPLGEKWKSLGFLDDADFDVFLAASDLLFFVSLNPTESFGIVQVEAMSQGTPVLAADLPGVRQAVRQTGLGQVVPIRDEKALKQALLSLLAESRKKRPIPQDYLKKFAVERVAEEYEKVMMKLVSA